MTREEALAYAISQKAGLESELHRTPCGYGNWALYSTVLDFINACISTLKGPTREQVEKTRGEWITKHYVDGILEGTNFDECSKCGYQRVFENPELKTKYMFCPGCGRAMWDEAVDMVMERLEEVQNDQ